MCKIITFNFNNLEVRTATRDNDVLFCLVDCCNVLNLKQPARVLERLNRDGVTQIKGVSKTTNQ
jgi:prophage antirepressor-like protein